MIRPKPTIVITGISGDLGKRLLPLVADYQVIGIDLKPPQTHLPIRFVEMDLGHEESCPQLMHLLRDTRASAILHLAFVVDQVRSGILDVDRMWRINVGGVARLMEAISETNRYESIIKKFIAPSSVAVYGPELSSPASEDFPLQARSLPYAIHKMEAEKVVQQRAPGLRGCSAYILRPHIFAGPTVDNYMVGAFRGTPNGPGERAAKMRKEGKRLPCLLPMGKRYLENRIQFVHVDDVARLIAYILRKTEPEPQRLTVLNVAGRGQPLSFGRCIEMAHAKRYGVPGKLAFELVLEVLWRMGISAIPPSAAPYMSSEYIMDVRRLQEYLGAEHEDVIHYTIAEAFETCFEKSSAAAEAKEASAAR
jgi:nucleoside-diphosphate-sugar epimerase